MNNKYANSTGGSYPKPRGRLWTCALTGGLGLVALAIVAAAIAYFYFYGNIPLTASEPAPGPAVTIQEPAPGAQVTKGDSFVFFATANDEAGVVRLDLWIDSTLALSQSSPDANGINPLSLSYPLVAAENGNYALIARAYNSQGEFGESVVHYVTVVEPAASAPTQEYAQYIVQEGDTLENIAARLGVSVED
ncbi:MAG: Ig-like domain-containing protein, partial [Anaerolineales bacterium]|nr:Ig-like domain-containing protein [Anaerolineales bacterium]